MGKRRILVQKGHRVLLHGRSPHKLEVLETELSSMGTVEKYTADLSHLDAVQRLAEQIPKTHNTLDV